MIHKAITALLTMAAVSTIWPVPVFSKSEQPVFVGTELSEINASDGRHKNLAFSEIALAATQKQEATENPPMFEDEDSGLTAVLQGCTRSSKAVNCSLLLTSTKQDWNVRVRNNYYGRTRVFDASGNEYFSASVQVGSLSGERYIETQLIQGIAIRTVVTFKNIPARVGKLTVLEIPVRYWGRGGNRVVSVRLRDLTISE